MERKELSKIIQNINEDLHNGGFVEGFYMTDEHNQLEIKYKNGQGKTNTFVLDLDIR